MTVAKTMSTNEPKVTPATDESAPAMIDEPTARLIELATMFDVSANALRIALEGPGRDRVRLVRAKPASDTRYAVGDVKALVEQQRAWFDDRRRRAAELEASQRAAKAAKKAANEARSEARRSPPSRRGPPPQGAARGASPSSGPKPRGQGPRDKTGGAREPEVIVVRRPTGRS